MSEVELALLDTYMFVDPAGKPKTGARLKKARSRQAIIVIRSDWLSRMFVATAWAGRLPTSKFTDKTALFTFADEKKDELLALKRMIEAGEIASVIDKVYTPERAVEAHRRVETEQRLGIVVIRMV